MFVDKTVMVATTHTFSVIMYSTETGERVTELGLHLGENDASWTVSETNMFTARGVIADYYRGEVLW